MGGSLKGPSLDGNHNLLSRKPALDGQRLAGYTSFSGVCLEASWNSSPPCSPSPSHLRALPAVLPFLHCQSFFVELHGAFIWFCVFIFNKAYGECFYFIIFLLFLLSCTFFSIPLPFCPFPSILSRDINPCSQFTKEI